MQGERRVFFIPSRGGSGTRRWAWATALAAASCAEPAAPLNADGDERIVVDVATPGEGLSGTYIGRGAVVPFQVGHDRDADTFSLAFGEAGEVSAVLTPYPSSIQLTVGDTAWSDADALTDEDRAALARFGETPAARAMVLTAARLYWEAPGQELLPHRVAALMLYMEMALFLPADVKVQAQPEGTVGAPCWLDDLCELRSEDALFGCELTDGTRHDVVPLLEGLPDGCALAGQGDDDTLHQPLHMKNECYGGCGGGCGGGCKQLPVTCTDLDANGRPSIDWAAGSPEPFTTGTSRARVCYSVAGNIAGPTPEDHYRVEDCEVDRTSEIVGTVRACTAAECCFQHDECHRHDHIDRPGQLDFDAGLLCEVHR